MTSNVIAFPNKKKGWIRFHVAVGVQTQKSLKELLTTGFEGYFPQITFEREVPGDISVIVFLVLPYNHGSVECLARQIASQDPEGVYEIEFGREDQSKTGTIPTKTGEVLRALVQKIKKGER